MRFLILQRQKRFGNRADNGSQPNTSTANISWRCARLGRTWWDDPLFPARHAADNATAMPALEEARTSIASLDHLIRPQQQRRRDGEAERLGGLEVDDEFERRGLLDWEDHRASHP